MLPAGGEQVAAFGESRKKAAVGVVAGKLGHTPGDQAPKLLLGGDVPVILATGLRPAADVRGVERLPFIEHAKPLPLQDGFVLGDKGAFCGGHAPVSQISRRAAA